MLFVLLWELMLRLLSCTEWHHVSLIHRVHWPLLILVTARRCLPARAFTDILLFSVSQISPIRIHVH